MIFVWVENGISWDVKYYYMLLDMCEIDYEVLI